MKNLIFVFIFICFCYHLVAQDNGTQEIAQAIKFYENKEYAQSFSILSAYTKKGLPPNAQCILANLYLQGLGTSENEEEGIVCLKKAIAEGYNPAKYRMAELYLKCYDMLTNQEIDTLYQDKLVRALVSKKIFLIDSTAYEDENGGTYYVVDKRLNVDLMSEPHNNAVQILEQLANEKYAPAQYRLAKMVMDRLLEETELDEYININKYITLMEQSSKQGYAPAQTYLGKYYVMNDKFNKGVELMEKAANEGYSEAMVELGNAYILNPSNYNKAMAWYKKAADLKNIDAYFYIANNEDNAQEKIKWYKKVVEEGAENRQKIKMAYFELGLVYENQKKPEESIVYYDAYLRSETINWSDSPVSYENGRKRYIHLTLDENENRKRYTDLTLKLGNIYYDKKEYEKAVAYYEMGKRKFQLAGMYEQGLGVKADFRMAMKLYREEFSESYSEIPLVVYKLAKASEYGYYCQKDNTEAVRLYRPLAEKGNEWGYVGMGRACLYGYCKISPNYSIAIKYFNAAIALNNMEAFYEMGLLYYTGSASPHLPKDEKLALSYFEKAANLGVIEAQIILGNIYCEGNIVEKNISKGLKFYIDAAEKGHLDAQMKMGNAYRDGNGVVQNDSIALNWYEKAANAEYRDAIIAVADMKVKGVKGNKDYNEAMRLYKEVGAIEKIAELEVILAARGGKIKEIEEAIEAYLSKNYTRAFNLLTSNQDSAYFGAKAANLLGLLYDYGYGTEENDKFAMYWYKKAANLRYIPAIYNFAKCFDKIGSYQIAEGWYKEAAMRGDVMSQNNLGQVYLSLWLGQNNVEALYWFQRADANNYKPATLNIAFMYDNGQAKECDALGKGWCGMQATTYYKRAKQMKECDIPDKEFRKN